MIPSAGRAREPEPTLYLKLLLSSFRSIGIYLEAVSLWSRTKSRSESAVGGPGEAQAVTTRELSESRMLR